MQTEIITRAATFEPSTFNAEKRTVDVVFSTGAPVRRYDFEGAYMERLSMTPEAVDLSAFSGAPVLNSHDRFDVRSILGAVDAASVDGQRGVATIRFGFGADADALARNVEAGIVRNVSVGYTISEKKIEKDATGARTITAMRWKPVELSFVALGADPAAKVRGDNMEQHEQIRQMTNLMGLPATFADGLIGRNATIEEARRAAVTELATRQPTIDNRAPVTVTRDSRDGLIERMADGLLARINPRHKPEGGKEFATFAISDIARRCLQEAGASTIGTRIEIIQRAMQTTSDFPNVLEVAFNKNMLNLRTSPTPILQLFRKTTADNFYPINHYEISDGAGLSKVNESGEIKWGAIKDDKRSSYSLASYAKGYSITTQVFANDNMGAIGDLSEKMGLGARSWQASLLVDTIIANGKLADGKAVFHADHGNLAGTGNKPGETQIAEAKLAMRLQTDLSGNPIDARPTYILIPAALETDVDKLMAQLYPQQSADAEVSARNLTAIVDPRFDAKGQDDAWYLFADPAIAPVFEYAELSGYEGPKVETRQGFTTLGMEMRVVWHLAAAPIDHRGAYKNPGA